MKNTSKNKSIVINTVLSLLAILWFSPFIYTLLNSIKSRIEYNLGNFWDIPTAFGVSENFKYLLQRINLMTGFFNSTLYALIAASFAILFAALAAYAISRLDIKGKMFWFLFIYSGTIFPFQMYLIPIFRMYISTNLYDTRIGLIIFYTAICIPFCIFVLRNFFMSIPMEVVESARLDGASDFTIFRKLFIPMAKAPLAALLLFQYTWVWNDLIFGMTFVKSRAARPIMASLSMLTGRGGINNTPAVLLAALIASVPTLLIFITLNKSFEKGFIIQVK